MLFIITNIFLAIYAGNIIYSLSLSFLGINYSIKQLFAPVLFFSLLIFISKFFLSLPPITHTVIIVILCTFFIYFFNNHIGFTLSMISSLLTMVIIVLGSLIIICPLLNKIGFEINNDYESIDWIALNIGELSIPTIFLIINKVKKLSLIKLILSK